MDGVGVVFVNHSARLSAPSPLVLDEGPACSVTGVPRGTAGNDQTGRRSNLAKSPKLASEAREPADPDLLTDSAPPLVPATAEDEAADGSPPASCTLTNPDSWSGELELGASSKAAAALLALAARSISGSIPNSGAKPSRRLLNRVGG